MTYSFIRLNLIHRLSLIHQAFHLLDMIGSLFSVVLRYSKKLFNPPPVLLQNLGVNFFEKDQSINDSAFILRMRQCRLDAQPHRPGVILVRDNQTSRGKDPLFLVGVEHIFHLGLDHRSRALIGV